MQQPSQSCSHLGLQYFGDSTTSICEHRAVLLSLPSKSLTLLVLLPLQIFSQSHLVQLSKPNFLGTKQAHFLSPLYLTCVERGIDWVAINQRIGFILVMS